jgi:hypothetical protein
VRALAVLVVGSFACGSPPEVDRDAGGGTAPSIEREATPAEEIARPRELAPVMAGEMISIPSGTLSAGIRPGAIGRRASTEADLVPIEIPTFEIDRLPYPNDPAAAPVFLSQPEAEAACATEGKRLCAELEWERACKGDSQDEYPGGASEFDVEACSLDRAACASPFGVLDLGATAFEWTASRAPEGLGLEGATVVVRGARATDPGHGHRCGARRALEPNPSRTQVAFRCCRGPMPELSYPLEEERRVFTVLRDVDDARLQSILRTIPELAPYAADFTLFDRYAQEEVLTRGGVTRENVAWRLEPRPLVWSPVRGEEAWVLAGRGGGSSLIAVIHPLLDGTFAHGASFVFMGEPTPIAIAYEPGTPSEILWSACWGCAGDNGSIAYRREDASIVVVQR